MACVILTAPLEACLSVFLPGETWKSTDFPITAPMFCPYQSAPTYGYQLLPKIFILSILALGNHGTSRRVPGCKQTPILRFSARRFYISTCREYFSRTTHWNPHVGGIWELRYG
ncbi:hypothetical protein GGR53DRAFT_49360 [Hypoxylon sp. FL1150]|nr:hypothetical protein GGR53DRAFT_49360 [Hypoxylon sp. FL1150]